MNVSDDLEDLFLQITKWSVLTNVQPTADQSLKNVRENVGDPEWIMDDYVSDLAHMKRKTNGINLPHDGDEHCRILAKVALLLQLSHVSYSTIADVLIGLQTTESAAIRVSKQLNSEITKAQMMIDDIQDLERRMTKDSAAKYRDEVICGLTVASYPQIAAADSTTKKKIAKYTEATQTYRQELDVAGAFAICPSETVAETISPNGIGPLPLSSLLAFSSILDQDDEALQGMLHELTAAYGEDSFSQAPLDLAAAEREIQELRDECNVYEEQYRMSLR
jgi:hypothetical protein